MTKIAKISLAVVMGSSILVAGANQMKLYDVKSGKIEYGIKGSGEIMGQKMQTIGKKRVIFDTYGAQNLTEENKIDKQTIMGQKKITKTHTMTYMKEGMAYHVDFKAKRIMRMGNMAASMGALMGGGKNMKQSGEDMMKQMGGKKTSTDKVLGYACDVWEMMGTKQCIYKGIPLRVETNVMGLKNTETATKAEFDISLSSNDFKLPDFPIYDMQGNKLDKNKLDAMDKKSEVQAAQGAEEMAALGASMAAAKQSAGIKDGERPTEAQQKKMEESMLDAMWPRMKKQILAEAKGLEFVKECFSDADTLKEANICSHKMDEMNGESSDPEGDFTEWNAKTKKETLGFLNQSLERMGCIKKANSMQDMQQCMPQEQKENKIKIAILSILLSVGVWAESTALFGTVVNVAQNDTLNVRTEPNYKAKKVSELPPEAYVGIEKCKKVKRSTWCRVYPLVQQWYEKFGNDSHIGWVNARYLKFSNRGYVLIKGKKNCAYALKCNAGKCEIVDDYENDNVIDYKKTGFRTKWIEREYLRGESHFGVTPDNVDGYCNTGMFIEDYLKKVK